MKNPFNQFAFVLGGWDSLERESWLYYKRYNLNTWIDPVITLLYLIDICICCIYLSVGPLSHHTMIQIQTPVQLMLELFVTLSLFYILRNILVKFLGNKKCA